MWHDGGVALRACPVRFLSIEAKAVLSVFYQCYAPAVVGLGGVVWQRIGLPDAGGVGDQEAWLLAALEHLNGVHNSMQRDASTRRKTKTPKAGRP